MGAVNICKDLSSLDQPLSFPDLQTARDFPVDIQPLWKKSISRFLGHLTAGLFFIFAFCGPLPPSQESRGNRMSMTGLRKVS